MRYIIKLREGERASEEQCFHISKKNLERIFNRFCFLDKGKTTVWMGHIAGNDTKHGEKPDVMKIDIRGYLLEFDCKNEKSANKCLNYFGLERAF